MHHLKLSGGCALRTPELSCGSQRGSCHLEGKDAGLIPTRERDLLCFDSGEEEGKAAQNRKGTCSLSNEMDISYEAWDSRKMFLTQVPHCHMAQEQEGHTLPCISKER